MSSNTLRRPALGQTAALGTLYDARSDKFLSQSLLRGTLPESAANSVNINKIDMAYSSNDTFKEKFNKMGINTELGSSFLAGLVDVQGSGRYLAQKRSTFPTAHLALHYIITTKEEKLNFASGSTSDYLDFDRLETGLATHVSMKLAGGHGVSWQPRANFRATRIVPKLRGA
jgi:hypothetical protein